MSEQFVQKSMYTSKKESKSFFGISLYFIPILILINGIFFNNSSISNLVLLSCSVISVFLSFLSFLKSKKKKLIYVIAVVAVVVGFVNTHINGSGYGSILTFACLLFLLIFFSEKNVSARQKNIIIDIMIASLACVLLIFSNRNAVNTYYYSILPQITVEHINPNTVGMLYFYLLVFVNQKISSATSIGAVSQMLWKLVSFGIVLSLSLNTGARTSLIAILVFFALDFLGLFRKYNPKLVKNLFLFGMIFTLLIPVIYVVLFQFLGESAMFWGKKIFTGREIIWMEAYEKLQDNWLWGYSNKYVFFNNRVLSVHNSLLAEWFVLGLIPLICCVKCISHAFLNVVKSKHATTAICALFACLVLMAFETILSDSNLYYYFIMLFIVAREDKKHDTQKNTLLLVRRRVLKQVGKEMLR